MKRESAPAKFTRPQRSLFKTTPNMKLDREKLDGIYLGLMKSGKPTYRINGYTFICNVCHNSDSNALALKAKFCVNCNILHGVDLIDESKVTNGDGKTAD